jgi:hypothetical protein
MSPAHAGENDVSQVTFGAGVFDLRGSHRQRAEIDAQYRFGWGLLGGEGMFRGIKPIIGVMATHYGAFMGWAGVAMPLWFDGGKWEIEPSMAIGAYHKGGNKGLDLGGVREFHLGANISYQIGDSTRLGVALTHISNAGSQRINPGANSGLVTFTWMFND